MTIGKNLIKTPLSEGKSFFFNQKLFLDNLVLCLANVSSLVPDPKSEMHMKQESSV